MSRSLRDELLKAGVVTTEQVARAERGSQRLSKPTKGKASGKGPRRTRARAAPRASKAGTRDLPTPPAQAPAPAPSGPPTPDPEERIRQLNLDIRRILDGEAEKARTEPADTVSDMPFHFARGNRLKRLYVSEDQRRRLTAGELAIVGFRGRHHLVPRRAGEQVRALRPEVFVFIADDDTGAAPPIEEGYEGYEVPDELVW